MTRRTLVLIAAGGSFLLLAAAFAFQALGYAPCKLCLWQRWPHGAAITLGALALVLPWPILLWGGMAAALTTAGIGLYHAGVEYKFWAGPSSCSGGGSLDLGAMSGADLLSTDGPTGVVMCDQVAWAFAGLSMASWNALFSFGLALIWLAALRARP
ncbi:MAG: disulfide bond formation protein B [Pseudomonadota bacterium]